RIAESLSGVPTTASGNVVVWSCWAGWPSGFCEQLAGMMKGRGYRNLRFWGSSHPTGSLDRSDDGNQWADVYVAAHSSSGDGYKSRRATRDDVEGFGPGLKAPYWRSYEAP